MTREWYFQAMGQDLGPLSAAELKAKVATGQIQPDTLIRKGPEGKWIFGANVKGLFSEPATAAIGPAAPIVKPKSSATLTALNTTQQSSPQTPVKTGPKPPSSSTIPVTIAMVEDETDSASPSLEFYDFVGFREAISPVLHDAIRQFASERCMTMSQLNRRALADFIKRPELASDLLITSVAVVPTPVNHTSSLAGPHSDGNKAEQSTFRLTLFNSSHHEIQVHEGVFLPKMIEQGECDSTDHIPPTTVDHHGHIRVCLRPLIVGKSIHFAMEETIPPHAAKEIVIWFFDERKPTPINVRGQFMMGHGNELAMSEYLTVTLHGGCPSPVS